jgi:hypothetical protein
MENCIYRIHSLTEAFQIWVSKGWNNFLDMNRTHRKITDKFIQNKKACRTKYKKKLLEKIRFVGLKHQV